MFLEFVRRMGREYERYVVTRTQSRYRSKISTASGSREELGETPRSEVTSSGDAEAQNNPKHGGKPSFTTRVLSGVAISRHRRAVAGASSGGILRPTFLQQLTRATLHMIQFGLAYFIMLLAMYYNGYFLICILIGAFIGSLIFSWEQVAASNNNSTKSVAPAPPPLLCFLSTYFLQNFISTDIFIWMETYSEAEKEVTGCCG